MILKKKIEFYQLKIGIKTFFCNKFLFFIIFYRRVPVSLLSILILSNFLFAGINVGLIIVCWITPVVQKVLDKLKPLDHPRQASLVVDIDFIYALEPEWLLKWIISTTGVIMGLIMIQTIVCFVWFALNHSCTKYSVLR